MLKPVKELPPNYAPAGGVSIHKVADLVPMLVWSIALPLIVIASITFIIRPNLSGGFDFATGDLLGLLGGILLVTVVMLIVHEGLHGLVFWLTTGEAPKFEFKWYYASASPGEWYLPRRQFMIATLLPLVAITAVGLALLPFIGGQWRYLLILLVVFNASGAAGDLVVALRLAKLPPETLSRDTGAEVGFYTPAGGA
jgi:hypothetical protein